MRINILLLGVVIGLVSALLTGGRLSRLGAVPIRLAWLVLGAVLAQAVMVYSPSHEPSLAMAVVFGLTHVALLVFFYLNRRLPGMLVLGLGFLLNALVMTANVGFMPISPEAWEAAFGEQAPPVGQRPPKTKDILLPRSQTVLWPLSDVFVLDERYPVQAVFSPGDALIAAGVAIFFHRTTKAKEAAARAASG